MAAVDITVSDTAEKWWERTPAVNMVTVHSTEELILHLVHLPLVLNIVFGLPLPRI